MNSPDNNNTNGYLQQNLVGTFFDGGSAYRQYNNKQSRDVLDIIYGTSALETVSKPKTGAFNEKRLTKDEFNVNKSDINIEKKNGCGCGGNCGGKSTGGNEEDPGDESFISDKYNDIILEQVKNNVDRFHDKKEYDKYLKKNNARVWIQENMLMMKIGRPELNANNYFAVPKEQKASMTFYGDPTRIFETRSYVEPDGGLRTKIIDQKNNTDVLNIRFNQVANEWIPDANSNIFPKTDEKLPVDANLDMINLQIASTWIGLQFLLGKKLRMINRYKTDSIFINSDRSSQKSNNKNKSDEILNNHRGSSRSRKRGKRYGHYRSSNSRSSGRNPSLKKCEETGEKCYINHDLVCSYEGYFPPFGKMKSSKIKMWLLCIGSFSVNVRSCCINHDIELWCTPPGIDGYIADLMLYKCITNKVLIAAQKKMDENWWCYFVNPFTVPELSLFYEILGVIGLIAYLIPYPDEYRNIGGINDNCCPCCEKGGDPTFDTKGNLLCGTIVETGKGPVITPP